MHGTVFLLSKIRHKYMTSEAGLEGDLRELQDLTAVYI